MSTDTIVDRRTGAFGTRASRLVKQLRPDTCSFTNTSKKFVIPGTKVDPAFVEKADTARSDEFL
jgi:hypothetical protein